MTTDNGGPAFSIRWADGHEDMGMSLRDWFAGQMASAWHGIWYEDTAKEIYRRADAMIAEREKR